MRWSEVATWFLIAGLTASSPVSALAEVRSHRVTGVAHTAADQRTALLNLSCNSDRRERTVQIEAGLWLPDHTQLERVYDFRTVENPYSVSEAPATLVVNGVAGAPLAIAGRGTPEMVDAYVFETASLPHDAPSLRRMASMLRPLTEGAGSLIWRQTNARRGGPPIEANFTITDADSAGLRTVLAPCLSSAASPPPAASAPSTPAPASTPVASVWRNGGPGYSTTADIRALGEGRFMVKIEGHAGECMLGVDGVATETAPGRMTLLTGSGGEQCRLGLERSGDSQLIIAEESDGCSAYHGARCNFLGTLNRARR